MKYPKAPSLEKYFSSLVTDRVHNGIKHGGDLKKYQAYLKPIRRKCNGHKTNLYKP